MASVCVVGAGPSGSTFAARMAQLGHDVTIVERARFPRAHLGESLSPGVLPLLATIGAREAAEAAGFERVRKVLVKWDGEPQVREDDREEGMLVDRGEFDRLLLERARTLGVRVLQPARVKECRPYNSGWTVDVEGEGGVMQLHADFLAEAGGRSAKSSQRRISGCQTLALYAYWRGAALPRQPRIEAGSDAWYWGVPLPDGTYNTLAFVDVKNFRATRSGSLTADFLALLSRSEMMTDCRDAHLDSPVRAIDATPYLNEDCVTPSSIRIGEAAMAIDPISSSGVQKAIQSALAAAVVANTLLRKPASTETAMLFYRTNLTDASERHSHWASSHYGSVAAKRGGKFWRDRGIHADLPAPQMPSTFLDARSSSTIPVALSPHIDFVELPCIEGEFVVAKVALRHPNLESPVVYLGGRELAPLLRQMRPGRTAIQLAKSWTDSVPLQSGLAIAGWLFNNGLLVEETLGTCARPLDDFYTGVAENPRP